MTRVTALFLLMSLSSFLLASADTVDSELDTLFKAQVLFRTFSSKTENLMALIATAAHIPSRTKGTVQKTPVGRTQERPSPQKTQIGPYTAIKEWFLIKDTGILERG